LENVDKENAKGTFAGELLLQRITEAGLTQTEVANKRGIRKETVHRHVNNKTSMNVSDAIAYGKILGCPPETLLFEAKPMIVMGESSGKDLDINLYPPNKIKTISWRTTPPTSWRAIKRTSNFSWLDNTFFIVDIKAMLDFEIDQLSIGKLSVVCTSENKARIAVPYKQSNNKFSLQYVNYGQVNIDDYEERQIAANELPDSKGLVKDVTLRWCIPIVLTAFNLDAVGTGEEIFYDL